MKTQTARLLLLVLFFGFLASHGWRIAEVGAGTGGLGSSPPSAALPPPRPAGHPAPPRPPVARALQPVAGAATAPATARPNKAAAPPREGRGDLSAPIRATRLGPETALASDPAADLTFPGVTNLQGGSEGLPGGLAGGPPGDLPLIGAGPGVSSPAVSAGSPHAKALPEPGSLARLGAGLMALGWWRRRARAA